MDITATRTRRYPAESDAKTFCRRRSRSERIFAGVSAAISARWSSRQALSRYPAGAATSSAM
eukprot:SAG22_NODE_18006_length_295_cov_0.739796_2_plen_61_part_01